MNTDSGSLPLSRLCIHQVTVMQADFRESIECFSRHGVRSAAVWREKLEETGVDDAKRILEDNGVSAVSMCAGGFTADGGPGVIEDNQRWIEQAAAIGAQSLVVLTGGLMPGEKDIERARSRALEGFARLAPTARDAGVRLAIEPLHPMVCGFRSVISTLQDALDMLDELQADDVFGVAVDTYGLWWDRELKRQIERAGSRIVNFHVADWLSDTRDVRVDRGMPGDGCIDNRMLRRKIEQTGYGGCVEVEVFSASNWWKRPVDDVVQTVVERSREHL